MNSVLDLLPEGTEVADAVTSIALLAALAGGDRKGARVILAGAARPREVAWLLAALTINGAPCGTDMRRVAAGFRLALLDLAERDAGDSGDRGCET